MGKQIEAEKLDEAGLAMIQRRATDTHLDYPHSRAVTDVDLLLGHIAALDAEIGKAYRNGVYDGYQGELTPAEQPAPEPEPDSRGAASVGAWTLPSEMVTPEVKAVLERLQAAGTVGTDTLEHAKALIREMNKDADALARGLLATQAALEAERARVRALEAALADSRDWAYTWKQAAKLGRQFQVMYEAVVQKWHDSTVEGYTEDASANGGGE